MPGLTEDYKMSLFFNFSKPDASLRYVIVAEEANVKMLDKYELVSNSVFQQLTVEKTVDRIRKQDWDMYIRQDLGEIMCLVVANTQLDQYT